MQTEKARDDANSVIPHPQVVKIKLGELYRQAKLLRQLLKVAKDAHWPEDSEVINAR